MRFFLPLFVFLLLVSAPSQGSPLKVDFQLPTFDVANYNAPYVAIWLETDSSNDTLLLWHMNKRPQDKWLKDIRRWWRKAGRYGEPPDGVSGATKGPGKYSKSFEVSVDGPFTFYIEVVREDGGRTLLKQKIENASTAKTYRFEPDDEISGLTLTIGQ